MALLSQTYKILLIRLTQEKKLF